MPKAKRKRKPPNKAPMMPLPTPGRRRQIPNAPPTAKWKIICANTRAAQAAIDASIAGVKLPAGPSVVFGEPRATVTQEDVDQMLDGAAEIAAAARPRRRR